MHVLTDYVEPWTKYFYLGGVFSCCFCQILLWKLTAAYIDNNVGCLFVS